MLISTIKGLTDPEKVFAIFTNTEASATLVDGDCCIHDTANPGVGVKGSAAALGALNFAGVAAGPDIPAGATGTFQVYGYHSRVKATTTGTAGLQLQLSGTALMCITKASDASAEPLQIIGLCLVALSGGRVGCFIRGM